MPQDEANNVVDFNQKREEKEQEMAQEQETVAEDPKSILLKEKMDQYNEWTGEFAFAIEAALLEISSKSNELRDISLPLGSLIEVFSMTAETLDNHVDPEVLPIHQSMRVDLANHLNREIRMFMDNQPKPMYQQDIFIALSLVLSSYLYEQRVYVLSTQIDNDGVTDDADKPET